MFNLLKVNGITFPAPAGSFDVSCSDITNDYDSEDGRTVIEVIREGVATISVSYSALKEEKLRELKAALKTVNTVEFIKFGSACTAQMRMSNLKTSRVHYKHDVSVWSMSFELKEL